MGNPPRTRKRVRGIRRAPDGSAFENCNSCGVLVAIALADLHECKAGTKNNVKRFKGLNGKQNVVQQSFCEQPRSPFRLFMEDFTKTGKIWNVIDIDRKGFETWRNMSKEERRPYITGADEINSAHAKCLIKDIDHMSEFYEHSEYHDDNSESFHSFQYKDSESFNTWERSNLKVPLHWTDAINGTTSLAWTDTINGTTSLAMEEIQGKSIGYCIVTLGVEGSNHLGSIFLMELKVFTFWGL
uniref:HMG box domain-containing protein n=1 Tax=Salix viminalis TaxID=40686 RepID=A0A6N2LED9_SALVM